VQKVPHIRLRQGNRAPLNPAGDFVLYWMTAFRRVEWNFSLQRAAGWAEELGKPLVVLEALRCGYPWASDRLHRFIIQGLADNRARLAQRPVLYYPYLEPQAGAGKGLLAALAERACLVVGDDFPAFFLPRMVAAAAGRLKVPLELVDSNGLLPLRAADKVFPSAYTFRRFLQKSLAAAWPDFPLSDPLAGLDLPRLAGLPGEVTRRWPPAPEDLLAAKPEALAKLPLDHAVGPVATRGGTSAARAALEIFLDRRLAGYLEGRNQPEEEVTSGLSPYLHFGHISSHQIFQELTTRQGWTPERLPAKANGGRTGWWGLDASAEAFVDQLITWRELGFNMSWQRPDHEVYESLPAWARKTLAEHAGDPRPDIYSPAEFEAARTHDPLWNAAQGQLLKEGTIHNYLRMLWGKKILEWSASPEGALAVMIELNNKYALDGRDPNSASGIFWVLGRYDRAWGPERPIFGKIRYMSSQNTARKVRVKRYIEKYGA